MGLSIRIPKFLKNAFTHKEETSTPTPSITSHRHSVTSSHRTSITSSRYSRDPMRSNNHPDVVGQYYDPMGGIYYSRHQGVDPTNTGA